MVEEYHYASSVNLCRLPYQITKIGITVFFYLNKTIRSQGYLKFTTLASHYSISVGCWAWLH